MQEKSSRRNMNWWTRMALVVISPAFALYALLTGGLVVSSVDDFGGQSVIKLTEGVQSDVFLAPQLRHFGVPFVFHYHGAGKPFSVRIQIWDTSRSLQAIEIAETLVEYKDGEVVRSTEPWIRKLRPYTEYHHSSSSGVTQTEMFMLSDRISDLVLRHVDAKITLTGHLVKVDGKRVAFKISETFNAQSGTQILTFWQETAGC